jgi:hypothetical protein
MTARRLGPLRTATGRRCPAVQTRGTVCQICDRPFVDDPHFLGVGIVRRPGGIPRSRRAGRRWDLYARCAPDQWQHRHGQSQVVQPLTRVVVNSATVSTNCRGSKFCRSPGARRDSSDAVHRLRTQAQQGCTGCLAVESARTQPTTSCLLDANGCGRAGPPFRTRPYHPVLTSNTVVYMGDGGWPSPWRCTLARTTFNYIAVPSDCPTRSSPPPHATPMLRHPAEPQLLRTAQHLHLAHNWPWRVKFLAALDTLRLPILGGAVWLRKVSVRKSYCPDEDCR